MALRSITSWDESIDALPDLPHVCRRPVYRHLCTQVEYPLYRSRADTELEPVFLSGAEAQVRLRSTKPTGRINAKFVNYSGREVQLILLDFDGNEVAYFRIPPIAPDEPVTRDLHDSLLFMSGWNRNAWIFRDMNSKRRLNWMDQQVVYFEQAPCSHHPHIEPDTAFIMITVPPLIEWTEKSHKAFPAGFKRSAAAFLMSLKYCLREKNLPSDLVTRMIKLAAPEVWQQINCPFPEGRADLRPARVPEGLTLEWYNSTERSSWDSGV